MKKLMTCGTVLAFALAAKAEITFDPDCVLYYDFETLDSEGKIVNLVKPGTMDGTVVTKTLTPELAEDSPARLRQSMKAADYETSESCLVNSIESADSRQNGYIECTPSDLDWFSKTNFTVECFFKTENMTQTQTPIFFRRGGPGIQVWLGTFGTAGTVGLGISTDTETTLYKTISAFTAGTWNHVALVVDQTGATKTAKTYFNGKLMETVSLSSNLAAEYKDSVSDQSGSWYVAGAKAGNSFDGKVDSMRVTLRALAPEEFLTDRPYASGSTITLYVFILQIRIRQPVPRLLPPVVVLLRDQLPQARDQYLPASLLSSAVHIKRQWRYFHPLQFSPPDPPSFSPCCAALWSYLPMLFSGYSPHHSSSANPMLSLTRKPPPRLTLLYY